MSRVWLTFNVIGSALSDWLSIGIDKLTGLVDSGLTAYGINPVIHSLIIDGIFAGVGSVLSFLPIIVTLFFSCPYLRTRAIWHESPLLWTDR